MEVKKREWTIGKATQTHQVGRRQAGEQAGEQAGSKAGRGCGRERGYHSDEVDLCALLGKAHVLQTHIIIIIIIRVQQSRAEHSREGEGADASVTELTTGW